MVALKSNTEIKELLKAGIMYQGQEKLESYLHSRSIPPSWEKTFLDFPSIRDKYFKTLISLSQELVPAHIGLSQLNDKLWHLFAEVVMQRSLFQSKSQLQAKIDEFAETAKLPLKPFIVIYEICNLDVGEHQFSFSDVHIVKATENNMNQLVGQFYEAGTINEWPGKTIAHTTVEVSSIDRVFEAGLRKVTRAINLTKLIALSQNLKHFREDMFYWEFGQYIAVAEPDTETRMPFSESFHGGFRRPLIVDMGPSIEKQLATEDAWQHIVQDTVPVDIANHLHRAIEWVNLAITVPNLDQKAVCLCIALEVLLLPNYTGGNKGEAIALNQWLIGLPWAPPGILALYEKRSAIVHRGEFGIVADTDYWHLLLICSQVIKQLASLSKTNDQVGTLKGLIEKASTSSKLKHFLELCEKGHFDDPEITRIKSLAEEKLKFYSA
ncbi:MAG: hypothetical protein ACLFVK_01155 [Dehalococcoidia bacterium]